VDYNTLPDNYYMTMDVYNDYGSCDRFDHLTSLLAGSGQKWYSSCMRICVHIVTIDVSETCISSAWRVLRVGVTVKGVKQVEVDVDDVQVFSVSCCCCCNNTYVQR